MNPYYEKPGIGTKRVSDNLTKSIAEIESWSEDERLAAKLSLKEDISDSENYNQLLPFVLLVIDAFVMIILEMDLAPFSKNTIAGIALAVVFAITILVWFVWKKGRDHIYIYAGLLLLLGELDHKSELHNNMQE